jgi:hypothetical protein
MRFSTSPKAVGENHKRPRGLPIGKRLEDDVIAALRVRRAVPRPVERDEGAAAIGRRESRPAIDSQIVGGPVSWEGGDRRLSLPSANPVGRNAALPGSLYAPASGRRALRFRRRSWPNLRISWCSRLSMAAMAARRSASARTRLRLDLDRRRQDRPRVPQRTTLCRCDPPTPRGRDRQPGGSHRDRRGLRATGAAQGK